MLIKPIREFILFRESNNIDAPAEVILLSLVLLINICILEGFVTTVVECTIFKFCKNKIYLTISRIPFQGSLLTISQAAPSNHHPSSYHELKNVNNQ